MTTHGQVWSQRKRIWLSHTGQHEYSRALLYRSDHEKCAIVVHKLVANTFPELVRDWTGELIPDRYTIDHHDQNKKHNCVSNLRIIPGGQTALGYQKGERKSKLRGHEAEIEKLKACGMRVADIAERFEVSTSAIYNLLAGRSHQS